jgi:hypothetical protein
MPALPGEQAVPLKKSGTVVLTAAGGVLIFDPDHANQRWEVSTVVTATDQAATATTIPVCTLALNTTVASQLSQGNQRGASYSGNQDTFAGLIDVGPCDYLSVIYTPPPGQSGTPLVGVRASAVVTGTKFNRRG